MEQYKSESQAIKRSGCEEELSEIKTLLSDIADLQAEEIRKTQTAKDIEVKAKEIGKKALESLTPKKE